MATPSQLAGKTGGIIPVFLFKDQGTWECLTKSEGVVIRPFYGVLPVACLTMRPSLTFRFKWLAKASSFDGTASLNPNYFLIGLIMVVQVLFVTMVYGPIAAMLVEMFSKKFGTPLSRYRITMATEF